MKRLLQYIILITVSFILYGCSKPVRCVIIDPVVSDSIKLVTVIDQMDTIRFDAPIYIPDSMIIKDSIRKIDSLKIVEKRVEFIQDSINFRKATLKINGGYNGWIDRYEIWLRARNILVK